MDCPPNVSPPECCAPPMSPEVWAERLWRIKEASRARRPYTCPHCGSGALWPTLAADRRRTWICLDCRREFCTEG